MLGPGLGVRRNGIWGYVSIFRNFSAIFPPSGRGFGRLLAIFGFWPVFKSMPVCLTRKPRMVIMLTLTARQLAAKLVRVERPTALVLDLHLC